MNVELSRWRLTLASTGFALAERCEAPGDGQSELKSVTSDYITPVLHHSHLYDSEWNNHHHHHVLLRHNGSKNNTVEYRHKHTQLHALKTHKK